MGVFDMLGLMLMGLATTALIVFGILGITLLWQRLRRRWSL